MPPNLKTRARQIYVAARRSVGFGVPQHARYALDAARASGATRMLLISDRESHCSEQQYAPFHRFRDELRTRLNLVFRHTLVHNVMFRPKAALAGWDVIGVKLTYRCPAERALRIVRTIAAAKPAHARLVYFDGDDDSAIQWPPLLPLVDLYVKKHMFADLATYTRRFVGKNNLTTYVSEQDGVSFADDIIPHSGPVDPAHLDRVYLGWNLALDDKILDLYEKTRTRWQRTDRPNDIVCRASMNQWLYHLRKHIAPRLSALSPRYRVLAPTNKVSQDQYDEELASSKLCVSPFGYGELCWRDFESVLWGCLMIKPDMAHIKTLPDIFVPYETYVPVRWDFSDLEQQCERFLQDAEQRQRIVNQAYATLSAFYERETFFELVADIFARVGVDLQRGAQPAREQRTAQS